MLMTFILIGGGAWLVASMLNKTMASPNPLVFGRFPANQLATGLGVLALLAAPVFGPLAAIVSFAGALGAAGGIISIMNQSGIRLIPANLTGGSTAVSGYGYADNIIDIDEAI